jgi:uncharacterized protein (DUF488 family)
MLAAVTLFTIGHSNHEQLTFVAMLQTVGISTLIDVRAQPRSQHNPHFNDDSLRKLLNSHAITYHWAGRQLGGRRGVAPNSPHLALEDSRRGFADYMLTDQFARAVAQLQSLARRGPTAVMCAEANPDHCHRALLADYLTLQGHRVMHLLADHTQREHVLHPQARCESAALIYDRHITPALL